MLALDDQARLDLLKTFTLEGDVPQAVSVLASVGSNLLSKEIQFVSKFGNVCQVIGSMASYRLLHPGRADRKIKEETVVESFDC